MTTTTKTSRLPELAAVLGCKPAAVLLRLKALELAPVCSRCGGGGQYSYCQMYGSTCFGCAGQGHQMPKTITTKLIEDAKAAVAAGKLQPYLDALAARAEAKKIGNNLLNDYASLTTDDKAALEAAGKAKAGWWWCTDKGSWTQAAAHPWYEAASKAAMDMQFEKDDAKRSKLAEAIKRFHAGMMASPADVPAGASLQVINSHKLESGTPEYEAHYAPSNALRNKSQAAVNAIKAELGL
jgi:hypothetical protein